MWKSIKAILTNTKFYLSLVSLGILGGVLLVLLDVVIMPAYTNYDEGVTVPDVSQVSLEEAQERLTSYGLRYKVAERRSNAAYPADYVIDQTPRAAEIVKPNRKVYLTVNTVANPTVKVPKVVDLSKRNATIQLQNYGLQVGTVSFESSRFKSSVLRQSVPPGKEVPKGTKVDLTVSDGLGEKMVTVPNIRGLRLSEAQQKIQEAGLRIGDFQYKPSKEVAPNVILDFTPDKEKLVVGETLNLVIAERFNVEEEVESGAIIDTTNVARPDTTNNN
jgi:beta-lactam-binding protein with PASTA domain